ncbi:MAG: phosphopantothenoylcysteine decarboxylase domain-containing protein [Sedimentisphaerales bacterium]
MNSVFSVAKKHFLITAGGTREYIDPVRFISNASSGKMGYELARAALKAGHKVTLITTVKKSEIRNQKSEVKIVEVISAADMFKAVKKHFKKCECLVMAAAVSDYTPIKISKTKIKKENENLTIQLKPTADILKWAGKNKKLGQIVVGFALKDRNLRKNAEKKLKEKNLDMIIANSPAAIGAEKSTVYIKQKNKKWLTVPRVAKFSIAKKIIAQIK